MKTLLTTKVTTFRTTLVFLLTLLIFLIYAAVREVHFRIRREARLHVAIARLYAEAYNQQQVLIFAIEAYKRKLGFYPPDHVVHREPLIVEPVTNQLLYELLGTTRDPTNETFTPPGFPAISPPLIKQFFGTETFKNYVESPKGLNHFLDITNIAVYPAKQRPDPVGLVAIWPNWEGMDSDLYQYVELAPWHYNSSAPVHNSGKFDLWVEIKTSETNIVLNNW